LSTLLERRLCPGPQVLHPWSSKDHIEEFKVGNATGVAGSSDWTPSESALWVIFPCWHLRPTLIIYEASASLCPTGKAFLKPSDIEVITSLSFNRMERVIKERKLEVRRIRVANNMLSCASKYWTKNHKACLHFWGTAVLGCRRSLPSFHMEPQGSSIDAGRPGKNRLQRNKSTNMTYVSWTNLGTYPIHAPMLSFTRSS
jgi:hypothetical protein